MSKLRVTVDDVSFDVEVRPDPTDPARFTVLIDGEAAPVIAPVDDEHTLLEWVLIDHRPYEINLDPELRWIRTWSGRHTLSIRDLEATAARPTSGDGRIKAPIPGLIAKVLVQRGERVETGQPVVVLEAMKMENEIRATRPGVVRELRVRPGQTVGMGEVLVEIV